MRREVKPGTKALVYCRQAGRKASARAASHEAISYLENALQALQHIPESRETLAQAIDLRFDLRREFLALSAFDQIHELLRTTEQLAETLGDPRRQGRVLLYLTGYYRINGNYDQAIEAGQRALVIAEAQDDLSLKVETWLYVAGTLYSLGYYGQATDVIRQALTALEGTPMTERMGQLVLESVGTRYVIALCLTEIGEFAGGIVYSEESVRIAEMVNDPISLVHAYNALGYIYLRQGQYQKGREIFERCLELCRTVNYLSTIPTVACFLGYAYALTGRFAEARPLLEQKVDPHSASFHSFWPVQFSEVELLAGHLHEARDVAHSALDLARTGRERGREAYTLRILGDIAMQFDPIDLDQAKMHFNKPLNWLKNMECAPSKPIATVDLAFCIIRQDKLPETEAILAEEEGQERCLGSEL